MDIEGIIREYGYLAIVANTFIEGETILALARECHAAVEIDRLLAEGAALSEDEALRLAWP